MTITLSGYLRDNPGGAAISGKTVSLLDANTDLAPTTTAHTNLSSTTDVTDANGFWEFTMDLTTGPLYVEVDLGGGNTRTRRYDEMFTYGGAAISALPLMMRGISDGIINNPSIFDFTVTPFNVRVLEIDPGYALIRGHLLGWDSGTKSLTGSANGSAGTTRHDFVVLRQWYAGANEGQQDIVLVEGTASTDPVVTTTESDLTKFIQGATIWDLPIARATLAHLASLYTVTNLRGTSGYSYAGQNMTHHIGSPSTDNLTVLEDLSVWGGDDATTLIGTSNGESTLRNSVLSGYVTSFGAEPAAVANAAAGVGATVNIDGNDIEGRITLDPNGTPSAGRQATITLTEPMPSANYNIHLTPLEADSMASTIRALPIDANSWELDAVSAPSTNEHIWSYSIRGY